MNNLKIIDDDNIDLASVSAINSILAKYREISLGDANYASTKQVKEVEAQKITFYFGNQVIGEVKFLKVGSKEDKIERCKKMLMKGEAGNDQLNLIGRRLYSPFCNFKIN